jgi:hypothetical protein
MCDHKVEAEVLQVHGLLINVYNASDQEEVIRN